MGQAPTKNNYVEKMSLSAIEDGLWGDFTAVVFWISHLHRLVFDLM